MNTQAVIEPLIETAIAAGREIMEVAHRGANVRRKDDSSPVTEADERAERVILKALGALPGGHMVVAEERAATGGLPEWVDGPFWLVDPLDGTKEFIKGGADFTVNIALIEDEEPSLGIVYCPADGKLFVGAEGQAWQAQVGADGALGERTAVRTAKAEPPLSIVASKSHRTAETDAYLAHYPDAELVSVGSSLKFCLVATGQADLYPRLGPTMEWDTAAGHGVLRAAGGRVVDAEGQPFRYYKPGFKNGHFLAWGDPDFEPAQL